MKFAVIRDSILIFFKKIALRENHKEDFQVFNNLPEFAKISREDKAFPLKISVNQFCGDYEIVFSVKEKRPSLLFHDYKFNTEERNIILNYSDEIYSNWIYVAIYAKEFTHIILDLKFSGDKPT